jgi:hypothetical protein
LRKKLQRMATASMMDKSRKLIPTLSLPKGITPRVISARKSASSLKKISATKRKRMKRLLDSFKWQPPRGD